MSETRREPNKAPCGYRKCGHPESAHDFRYREYTAQDGVVRGYWGSRTCQEPGCPCRFYRTYADPYYPPCTRCGNDFAHVEGDRFKLCPDCREAHLRTDDLVDELRREHRRFGLPFDDDAAA